MANKLLIKRGTRAKLPALGVGEPAFCTDTKELFVGSATGNVQYPNKDNVFLLGTGRKMLPSGTNLNTIMTPGSYYSQHSSGVTTGMQNVPVEIGTGAFRLEVETALEGHGTVQTIHRYELPITCCRYFDNVSISEWTRIDTSRIIEWTPHLYGSNGKEITLSSKSGTAVVSGHQATCMFSISISNINGATGYLKLKGYPFLIRSGSEFATGGYMNDMATSMYSSYRGASVEKGDEIVFRPVYVAGGASNAGTIKVEDIKAGTLLQGTFSVVTI